MLVGIEGALRDYAWGSRTAIAELTGRPASGGPEAELWFGAHPSAPSIGSAATPAMQGRELDAVIAEDPHGLLGDHRERLPFLLKLLAADAPLSLQVHPDAEQAREGFEREERAGVPIDAPERNYKDASHKPEMILALSATFEALAGFRHLSESRMLLSELAVVAGPDRDVILSLGDRLADGDPEAARSTGSSAHVVDDGMPESGDSSPAHTGAGNALQSFVEHLLRGGEDVDREVAAVVSAAARTPENSSFAREWNTVAYLAEAFPGDPGIVVSLLLNRISLRQGQALALPAGAMHAYLEGVGVELMAASDNVLRGGLTAKHVDVDELLKVVRFEALPSPIVAAVPIGDGLTSFRLPVDEFQLVQVALGDEGAVHGYTLSGPEQADLPLTGPAILLCLSGAITVTGASGAIDLARGQAAFVSADERALALTGSALAVVATTP